MHLMHITDSNQTRQLLVMVKHNPVLTPWRGNPRDQQAAGHRDEW